jgi:hypothetical protein
MKPAILDVVTADIEANNYTVPRDRLDGPLRRLSCALQRGQGRHPPGGRRGEAAAAAAR